ncbi:uncharacterized protein LOC130663333 [Microplitis mediator]|uniref:uncharacterized protein LOC130663333 n=1 Tax=Microplitis mediator TaxID=375433 RepID=UPI00255529F1|nr:uncharacterized protein LOC130663333 [Microplitis mediator]
MMRGFYLESLTSALGISLSEYKVYSCGREKKNNDITIVGPLLSRRHCLFLVTQRGLQILDLNSVNGIYINGNKIPVNTFKDIAINDIVGIGTNKTKDFNFNNEFVYRLHFLDTYKSESCSHDKKRKLESDLVPLPNKLIKKEDTNDAIEISDDDECQFLGTTAQLSVSDTDSGLDISTGRFSETQLEKRIKTESDNSKLNDSKKSKEAKIAGDKGSKRDKTVRDEKSRRDIFKDLFGDPFAMKNKSNDKNRVKNKEQDKDKIKNNNKGRDDKKKKSCEDKSTSQECSRESIVLKKKIKVSERTIVEKQAAKKSTSAGLTDSSTAAASARDLASESSSPVKTDSNTGKRVSTSGEKTKPDITSSEKKDANSSPSPDADTLVNKNKDKVIEKIFPGENHHLTVDCDEDADVELLAECEQLLAEDDEKFRNDKIQVQQMLSRRTNEFLSHIFKWDLAWLDPEKYKTSKRTMPLEGELIPQLGSYASYDDYDKIMCNLILQKIWFKIDHSAEDLFMKKNPSFYATVKKNSIKKSPIGLADETITEFEIEIELPLNRSELKDLRHPESHDFLMLELPVQTNNGKIEYQKIFACTKDYLKTPRMLTYEIATGSLPTNIVFQRKLTLRSVCRIDKFIRMAKAIKFLPFTPLMKGVIQPDSNKEVYALPKVPDYKPPKLITNDNLTGDQTEAVLRVANALAGPDPKICLLEVSRSNRFDIIVNIITEIVYGKNKYRTDERNRILVCAHSDASADDITSKLIDVREKLKNDHKPMEIVRIGNPRIINPRTQDVFLNEITRSVMNKGVSNASVDQEVNRLRSKFNQINMQLKSSNCSPAAERQLTDKLKHCESELLLLKKSCKQPHYDDKEFKDVNNSILWKADVITSVSSSFFSHQMESAFGLESQNKIDICIIDEENFNYEPGTLTTFMLGATKILLIRDPSVSVNFDVIKAKKFGNQSLFSHISEYFDNESPVISLTH